MNALRVVWCPFLFLQRGVESMDQSSNKKKKRKKERLSERDLKNLMGVNMPRYKRKKGGAYKQR